jgi:arylsulfatase A-like enzyme
LCNVQPPEEIDGKSLVPVISGKSEGVRSSIFTAYRNTVRAVRTEEWKLIRYPERDFSQLFNLASDPLELNNLAEVGPYKFRVDELTTLLKEWQMELNDKAPLTAAKILPLQYDHTKLVRKSDQWQPEYTLNKYFKK